MRGSQLSLGKKVLSLTAIMVVFVFSSQLTSCVAGTRGASDASAPAPGLEKMGKYDAVDVTDYYSRKSADHPRSVAGLATFETDNFIGSGKCAACHELLVDSAGNDMSIAGHWRSTMMANAAKDPIWIAKVSSEVKRNPALKKVIEEKCTLCHMPMAWTQAYKEGGERVMFDDGFLSPQNALHAAAMDGVSCSLCHQVQDEKLGQKESFSGKFVVDTVKKAPEREIFGPYKDPVQKVMQKGVGFTPVFGSPDK